MSSGEAGSSWFSTSSTTSTAEMAADAKSVVEARPFGIAKHSAKTESALEVLPGEAASPGSRAGGTTGVVEVPKISCQGKVEVVKNIPQKRNCERIGKQSRVVGVPKISCVENVDKIMKSFDARRETRPQFLERVCERLGYEVAIAVGEGFLSSVVVREGFSLVVTGAPVLLRFFLLLRSHVACVSRPSQNYKTPQCSEEGGRGRRMVSEEKCTILVGQVKRSVEDVTKKKARRSTACTTARVGQSKGVNLKNKTAEAC